MFVSSPRVSVHTEPIDTWVLVIRFLLHLFLLRIIIIISDLKAEDEGTYYCHLGADPAIKMPVHLLVDGIPHPHHHPPTHWCHSFDHHHYHYQHDHFFAKGR